MKIIHTADIHLNSPLVGVANSEKRRAELLAAVADLSQYAQNNGVQAVIVAGDLFDDQFVTPQTVQSVAQIISDSGLDFFILQGNHGNSQPYLQLQKLCPQVKLFGEDWTTYNLGPVSIVGRELGHNDRQYWNSLSLDGSRYNILVLHGDVDDDTYGFIDKKAIAAQPINYVALGHRHTFCQHKFGRVLGAYCGVLESRGFDEPTSGFVVIDTDTNKIAFHEQYRRRVVTKQIDVTAVSTDLQLEQLVLDSVADISKSNYLNLIFVGKLNGGVRLLPVVNRVLEGVFFALRVKDNTTVPFDLQQLQQEVSLRGEFVKLAMQLEDPQMRSDVLALGLDVLNGGDLQ